MYAAKGSRVNKIMFVSKDFHLNKKTQSEPERV